MSFPIGACESHLLNSEKHSTACTRQVVLKWLCNRETRFSWPSLDCFISARFHSQLNLWPMPDENSFSLLQIQMRRLRGRVEAFQCHNLSKVLFSIEKIRRFDVDADTLAYHGRRCRLTAAELMAKEIHGVGNLSQL